jgi:BCD family chlorophyll transporter-like MFS transporter
MGGLLGFALASHVLGRGADPFRMAAAGAFTGAIAFMVVILSAPAGAPLMFAAGVFALGFGGGLFSHGTLTATMNLAPRDHAGLALGAWGAVQATAAGIGIGLGGIIRDLVQASSHAPHFGPAVGYNVVYTIEIILLAATLIALFPLVRRAHDKGTASSLASR